MASDGAVWWSKPILPIAMSNGPSKAVSPKPSYLSVLRSPPGFCQCAKGACDQPFEYTMPSRAVFLYPSAPAVIANTIENAVTMLRSTQKGYVWRTWRDFAVTGQTIFCEICKQLRFTDFVVADVTTLNFNLLYEIGFAIGLEQPVVPIRDTTYGKHKLEFDELGMLDTIGYLDFSNADQLQKRLLEKLPIPRNLPPNVSRNAQQPLYVVKGHVQTDGELKLLSLLKKSNLRFRTFDIQETPRLSLHEARRQVALSYGVIAHLLDPERTGALVHNARCALIAGMATATGKSVMLLQEGSAKLPVDYRDLVIEYGTTDRIQHHLELFVRKVILDLQDATPPVSPTATNVLEKLDWGDVAAENEIQALRSYFVRTSQFSDAKRGSGRLVTGRKGAGKTAIFYAVRNGLPASSGYLVLDLKPEGFQFTKLRDAVLSQLAVGFQEHTATAFWEYILLCEMAQKIVDNDYSWAARDEMRRQQFEAIRALYAGQPSADAGDFSERLLGQVDMLVDRFAARPDGSDLTSGQLTHHLFRGAVRQLEDAIAPYLRHKEAVWVLVDNLDKSWPTRGAKPVEILIIRALLDATRKLQRQLEQRNVGLKVLVFLRNDIYDLLLRQTSDRGKDTEIALDWNDPELFQEIARQRIMSSTGLTGGFGDVWSQLFDANVGMVHSFQYILDRTLMRPRDLLTFLKRAVETAINRGNTRVREDDILKAEKSYSEDMLKALSFELRDIHDDYSQLLYGFRGTSVVLDRDAVRQIVRQGLQSDADPDSLIEVLLWFSFLGVLEQGRDEGQFAYRVRYNLDKLTIPISRGGAQFVIHPAFHAALA